MRPSMRQLDQMRTAKLHPGVSKHAEGSCLIHMGDTIVHCTASLGRRVPPFRRNTGLGWLTAEYGMLPRATTSRGRRESKDGRQTGRTHEIQRLIGRALRSGLDLAALGERQIVVDCDVIQADGGTRCASITGGWVATRQAIEKLIASREVDTNPVLGNIAAISCGVYAGQCVLDLDYAEDAEASADANFVLMDSGKLVEVQCSAEGVAFSRQQLERLIDLAEHGCSELFDLQKGALTS